MMAADSGADRRGATGGCRGDGPAPACAGALRVARAAAGAELPQAQPARPASRRLIIALSCAWPALAHLLGAPALPHHRAGRRRRRRPDRAGAHLARRGPAPRRRSTPTTARSRAELETLADRMWELQESEERFRGLIDALGDLVVHRDRDGRHRLCQQGLRRAGRRRPARARRRIRWPSSASMSASSRTPPSPMANA